MKYVKLGVALFAIFALTSGLALLLTGWVIAGSANTKSAERKYHHLVYEQALVTADNVYDASVEQAEGDYDLWYEEWLVINPKPSSSDVLGLRDWDAKLKSEGAQPLADRDAEIKTAGKVRDSSKADAAAAYDRALLNIKRNFTGVDNGQEFTGTYRVANILTTIKAKENGNRDWSSVTYQTVLSPAGALLVAGMVLTLVGGAMGVCMMFTYLGVWEKIVEKSKQPKAPKEPKAPKQPKEPKRQKHVEDTALLDEVDEVKETFIETAPEPEPEPVIAQPQPSIYGNQWQS